MTLSEVIDGMFGKSASSPAQRAVNAGAPDAEKDPSDAKKRAGNYRKVHLNIDGFRVSIENPKGSVRSGVSPDGVRWSNTLACDYGDIRGTESVDGDPVDIYLSDHPEKGAVFVIDQIDPKTKKFDEHKVMYGFDSVEDAKKTYLACYQKGWGGLGWITPVSKAEFRKWIDSSTRKTKPFHEYASVTPIVDTIKVKAAEDNSSGKGTRLYTYLPKDNTALTNGLLSTVLTDSGFEKYRGRTGKYKREDVLKVLDSLEPDWTRSKAISALTEPIPPDAAEDFQEFARDRRLYSFDINDLIKARILAHIRRSRNGGGTDPVDEVKKERPNWHRKKKHLLFQGVPHYFVETTDGRIPPEFVREEKKADAHLQDFDDIVKLYKDRYGIDLSHVRMKWSLHPRYNDGSVSHEFPDDEHGVSQGRLGEDSVVWMNPKLRQVMDKFKVQGKLKDFRRLLIAHELAHEIDSKHSRAYNPEFVRKMIAIAKKNKFRTGYTDHFDPVKAPKKFDKELFAEYMAKLLTDDASLNAEKTARAKQDDPMDGVPRDFVKQGQFVPINTLKWMQEIADQDKISPDEDTRHFFDTIVPYIKSHSDTAGTPGVDYNASKFKPGFYRSVDIRKEPMVDGIAYSSPRKGVRISPKAVGDSSTLVHELKHQQNQDGFIDNYAWKKYIPFIKMRFAQSGRSAADDRILSDTYHFTQDVMRLSYPGEDEERLKRRAKREQGTTHAEHQFAIMRELKDKLGRNPTGEEFTDYVRTANLDRLNAWRKYAPNGYQENADKRSLRPSYGAYKRVAEEEAGKLNIPRWVDYAAKSDMDKYKQKPWYNPDIFRMASDDGDPFDKTTERGIRGGFNPKSMWIRGRILQMMKQDLETFRSALMNVAKNKVRSGGLYQNAQNAMRGMSV